MAGKKGVNPFAKGKPFPANAKEMPPMPKGGKGGKKMKGGKC